VMPSRSTTAAVSVSDISEKVPPLAGSKMWLKRPAGSKTVP